jgi:hypothetical protein
MYPFVNDGPKERISRSKLGIISYIHLTASHTTAFDAAAIPL